MNPDRYRKLRALADDPRTPQHERAVAAERAREHEGKHGRPIPCRPCIRFSVGDEHDMRDLCATCGKDWALHWVAASLNLRPDEIRDEARSCGAFVPKMKPPRRKPRPDVAPVPWWTLSIRTTAGKRLGLTYSFRCALREVRAEMEQPRERKPRGVYAAAPETLEHIERGEVAWRWFPGWQEDRGWRPPPEMRAAMRKGKQ